MPGWIYMNSTKAGEHFSRLDESRFPIERGFYYTHQDLGIATLFQMLQSMSVDVALYDELFRINLLEEYADIWQALVEKG